MESMRDVTKKLVGENKMATIVRKEDNERIIANIIAKHDELYNTNRTLIDQNSQAAWEAVQENWKYMRELEARLIDRKNPKIYKEC